MIQQVIEIIAGPFKGHRGRVLQVNGEQATIELTSRPQKVSVLMTSIRQYDDSAASSSSRIDGGQSAYNPRGGFGGNTAYGGQSQYGGQTMYDAGKTPAAFTPMHQNAAMTPYQQNDWGRGGATGNYEGANTNYNDQGFSKIGSEYGNIRSGAGGATGGWGNNDNLETQTNQGAAGAWGEGGTTPGIKKETQAAW